MQMSFECWDLCKWSLNVGTYANEIWMLGLMQMIFECWDLCRWLWMLGLMQMSFGCWDLCRWLWMLGLMQMTLNVGTYANELWLLGLMQTCFEYWWSLSLHQLQTAAAPPLPIQFFFLVSLGSLNGFAPPFLRPPSVSPHPGSVTGHVQLQGTENLTQQWLQQIRRFNFPFWPWPALAERPRELRLR